MRDLDNDLLERPVRGTNLAGPTLGQNLGPGPTLVAFLRHFG
jgi:hypothetical protein